MSSSNRLPSALFEELEPRLLLSADGLGGLDALLSADERELGDATGQVLPAYQEFSPLQADPAAPASSEAADRRHEIVFVDGGIEDHEALVAGFLGDETTGSRIEVIVLDPTRDGIAQIGEYLSGLDSVDAVHIVSHGTDAALDLGDGRLDSDTIEQYASDIAGWSRAFAEGGDLLIYGCNLAASENGQALVERISELTGADVAASQDLTGHASLGGDWDLEYTAGTVETTVAASASLQNELHQVLVTHTVSSLADSGDGSLRKAMLDAKSGAGGDSIEFTVTGTISLLSGLPPMDKTVTIDGSTAPGYVDEPLIRIDGSSAGSANGLHFESGSDNSTVRGLMITNFTGFGIQIDATVDNTTVAGNWIGTSGTGSSGVGNTNNGINVQGTNTIIGGLGANDGNVITNNSNEGINLMSGATGTVIRGNIIGLDPDGATGGGNTDVGIAVLSGAHNTVIGGAALDAQNVISNNFEGIEINSNNNTVQGNLIGTDITGTLDRGNDSDDGVEIQGTASNNLIGGFSPGEGNLIAFNDERGVRTAGSGTGNEIVGNTITQNVQSGIHSFASGTEIVGNVIYSNGTNGLDDEVVLGASQTVYHNTIHGSADDGISVEGANAIIRNNIITGSAGYGIRINGGSIAQESHNLITDAGTAPGNLGGRASFALDASDLNVDPLYLDAANGDFRLTDPGSPAIDAGVDLGGSQPDVNGAGGGLYDGTAPDMGVFESWASFSSIATATFQQGVAGYTGTQDTFVDELDEFNPTADHGNENAVDVDLDDGGGNTANGLIRFDDLFGSGPGQIPFGSTIDSASLTVYVTNPSDATAQIRMHQMLIDWNESSNWDSTGSGVQTDNTDAASAVASMLGDPDVTGTRAFTGLESTLQAWSDGSANYGWVIVTDDTNGLDFSSSEEAVAIQRPKLTISYTPPENAAPTTTNNTVIASEDIPYVFTAADFQFADADTGDTLQQVQITALETVGSLKLGGLGVTLDQVVTRAAIDAGDLTFEALPEEFGTGYDSFEFRVHDGTSYSAATSTISLLDSTFDADAEGYTYADISNASWANGSYDAAGGVSGGGLRIDLAGGVTGGVSSGGWSQTFNLTQTTDVTVSTDFRLLFSEAYEATEYGELFLKIDGVAYGNDTNSSLIHTIGDGNGGAVDDSGWLTYQTTLTLAAGNHTLELSAVNNDATAADEYVEAYFDNVSVTSDVFNTMTVDVTPVNDAPIALQATSTSDGGLTLNSGVGNDTYFVADNGIPSALTRFTVEVRFAADNIPSETVFFSYNTASGDMLSLQLIDSPISLELDFGTGAAVESTVIDYYAALVDGQPHTLSVTWDNVVGDWQVFIDGALTDSGTGLSATETIPTGGTLMFGQEQDSVGGGFDPTQYFSGTLYDARLFDDLRSATEIAGFHDRPVAYDEANLVANWRFDDLSTDGVVTEAVSGNNLTLAHVSGGGFTASTPTLTLEIDENAANGTLVGIVTGVDPEREAQISALLAANPGMLYSAETGKFYQVSSTSENWVTANSLASSTLLNGVAGELVTIESKHENDIVHSFSQSVGDVWIGASDAVTEGEFNWYRDGAESTERLWTGDDTGSAPNGVYTNFASGEPSDSLTDRDYVELDSGSEQWQVETNSNTQEYVIQWNADEVLDATDPLTYNIQSQTVSGAFAIDADTGAITVADRFLLDFDTNAMHTLTVRVTDVDGDPYDEVFTISLHDSDRDPANDVPGPQSTDEEVTLTFSTGNSNRIAISDDVGETPTVTVTVSNGTLTVSGAGGATVSGDGTATVTLSGSVADINLALDGLQYDTPLDWNGADTLTISTVDGEIHAFNIEANLEGYYTFDSAAPGADSSLAGANPGTVNGATSTVDATRGDVLTFDGDDYVEFTGHFGDPADVTVAAWVNLTMPDTNGATVFSLGDSVSLRVDEWSGDLLGVYYDGSSWNEIKFAATLAGTGWHHVAYTVDDTSNTQTLYLDGVAVATGSDTGSISYSLGGNSYIGTHGDGNPTFDFIGDIDEGRVFSRALSGAEIASIAMAPAKAKAVDTVAITVDPVDDPLSVSTTGNTVLFTEDAGATTALFTAAMDTVESGDTVTQVVLTLANVEVGDTLTFGATSVDLNTNAATGPDANGFTYTVSSAGASPVVTISHAGASDTLTNTMLNSLVFNNTANNDPSTTARTVTLTSVTDSGSGLTNDGTVATVNVAKADDPLAVSTTGSTVLFTEDAGATTALFAAAMDTVEAGDTVTQVVLTLANVEAGDTLAFGATSVDLNTNAATGPDANGFTYTVSSAGTTPVVTISHAGATDTLTNTMLNSLVFNNTANNDPGTTARTVTLTSVTDSGSGLTADGTVATVNVAKADDPLVVSTTGNTVLFTEGAGATTALFAAAMDTVETGDTVSQLVLTLANVEAGDTLTFGATSVDLNTNAASGPDANGFTYTVSSAGASPVVTITHAGATDTLTNTMLNSLVFNNTSNDDPSTTARTVTLTSVTDSGSGLTADGTVATVNVAKADDPLAVATTGNTVLFTEDAGATTALFAAAMDTVETGDTVTQMVLTLANVEAGDTLSFGATSVDLNTNAATGPDANGFTYTVSSAGATPVVTITHAGATDTLTNTMLNSLVFNNTANNDPSTTARTVTLTSVTDSGSGLTNDGTVATVNVAKANDPLVVSTTGNTVLFTEDAGATTALFAAAMDTVETGDTVSQVVLTLANVEAGDTLSFGATSVDLNTNAATGPDANGFTYTVSSAGATPVVTISHAGATDTLTNTMLNSLVFNNTSNNDPSTTARTVTLTSVTDSGSGLTADGTVATVNVAKADDPLSVSTTGNTVLFTEDAGATGSLFAATMDTVETGDTVSQVVLTLANVEAGDTVLFGATSVDLNTNAATGPDVNGFTYTVSSAGASPVVTISHAGASDALTNAMLNSLVFNNTSNDDPSTTARTVTLTSVTDSGSGLTNDGTVATVNVAKADDPLAVSTTGSTVLFTEDAGATTALFAAAMDTVEAGDTVSQVVLTLANVETGDTLTFGATSVDLNTNGPTGPDANGFTYTVSSAGASPVVTISHAGTDDATVNTMMNSLVFNNTSNDDPSTTARTVTLTSVTDSGSGLTNDGTVATVNVAKADDPLSVSTTGSTVLFTEDAGATTALFAAAMDTVEAGDTVTQVVLTLANVEAGDTLAFGATSVDLNTNAASGPDANGFTYTVSSAGASPVVTITHAGATDTLTNTMLNSLVFNNTSNDDPSTTARTVTLTSVTDSGSGLTADGTVATVNVAKADDPLAVATTGNTVLFTEDAGATTALFTAAMDTVETGDTVSQLVLTLANVEAGDTLSFGATSVDLNTNAATGPDANGFTYTVSSAGATPVVTISHAGATDTLTNTMLNSLVFINTANNDPGTTARTVTLTSVTDSGSGLTADGTVATVNVAKADDPLSVSTTGNTVLFTEDAGATSALFTAAMDTVETGDTVSQVVLTLANVEAGDTLSFGATSVDLNTNAATGPDANGFTYTVSSAGASPVVTITHAGATDTLTNTMLNSLVFNNTANNDPGTTARTVTLTSVTDSGSGLTADGTVATVNVAKADDPLSVSTTGNTVLFTEDAGATTALFAAAMDTVETGDTVSQLVLTLANVEAGDTLTFGATSVDLNTNAATGPDANGFTYTVSSAGATPVVTITHAGATDTLTNTMLNSLVFNNTANNDPSTTARTVTLTSVTDSGSGLTNDGTVATVNVAKADDPLAVATTGNTVLFTEDAGATSALFAAAMDTVEAGDTVSQLVLTLANVEAGDTLTFGATSVDLNTNGPTGPDANGFTYTVSSAGASPAVTITHAGATDTLTNTMLNSLVFNNTSNNDPSTTARTVTLTSVTDSGSGLTNDGTVATVNVAKADDPLVVSTTGNTVLFTEDAGATTALFAAAMDTVESGDTVTQVILTLANVEAGDTLAFGATSVDLNTNAATGPDANGFTYTVSSAGATPVVTITHAGATDTLTNTMLNSLVFNNTANNDPSTTARTVTLTSVTDSGSGLTNDGTVATVNVAKADDPLSVSTTGNTVLLTEDAGATTALFAAAMDTVETGDTVTQLVLTLANVEAGDTLAFGATSVDLNTNAASGPDANGFTYTVSSAGATPVVTITHAGATDTLTNTMLNSLVFNNTSNNDPSTTARTVTLTSVTDSGSGLTNDGTVATVNVAKADDPLVVSTTGNTVLFTEDAGATTALFAAAMDTVETGDTVTQMVLTLANVEAGDTVLFGATSVDLNTNGPSGPDANGFTYTVSSAGASPVVTITHAGATDTLTNTMLNSLVFNNTSNDDPSTTARTVTLTSVTDSGSGLTADGTVATVNVAKADDPLSVSTTGNTVLFTEDAGATTALFTAAMDTVETGDTVSQVVLTLANVEAGDTLAFGATSVDLNTNAATGPDANGFTYTVSSAGATPVVTISHAGATDTLTNTMLNSLVFNNTANNDPGTTARTVTLTSVTDSGSGLTADGTVATVNVAKADDPLSVSTTGNTVLLTEDAGATTALFAAAMDTVETGDTVSQLVLTLANVEAGDTVVFGATSVDLNTNAATGPDANGFTYTVSSAGATPVVAITHAGATDTLTNTMLNSLVFNNTSNNDPSTTARTVTLTSVTDSGSGLTADGTLATVNVAKADDPLAVSTTGNTVLFTEDAGATTALFAATMDTVETGDTVSQLVLTLANVEAGDTVVFGATSVDLNTNAATGPDANGFTYTVSSAGATPVVAITHAGATDTLTNTMLNSLVFNNTSNDDPSTTARTVTLTSVTDSGSGLTNDGTVATVNVAKANDPLVVSTTGNTVLFTEDAGATTALFAATMDTVETGDTVSQLVLTLANVEAGDTLTFGATSVDLNTNGPTGPDANGFTYTVSSAGATPVVTISHAGATDTLTNTMLNSLVFNNTSNNDPSTTARTVTLTSVTDSGSGLTADGTVATVNVTKANDPLVVSTTGNTVLFTEDAGATTALFTAAMDTVETGDTVSQLVLTLANVEAGDTLTFGATSVDLNTNAATGPDANGFTYTVSSAGATPVVTISHAGATDTLTNTMLNSLVFINTANNDPGTTARTVTLTSVTDSGSGLTADGTVATVNVAKADDPLSVSTTGNTVLFTEDAGATTALFTAAMDTVETGDTVSQVVLTLANVEAGDTLSFGATSVDLNTNAATGPDANGFTYTVSSAGATPVVTITHAGATDTLTNTMLNSLVFNNTANNDPSTTARTVTLTSVTDSGSGLTNDGTVATVNVAKADDPLAVATTGNTVLFTEDAGATSALFAAAMDTVEAGDTVSQLVLTLANVEAGDTLTFGATSVDLNTNGPTGPDANGFTYTVSSAGATPVVTISHAGATDTLTNTMLNSLVFNNTSNNDPSTTARTVTLTSVTDSGSGLTADGTVATVNVAKADDPLSVSTTGNTVLFTEDAGATGSLFTAAMDTVETGDTVSQVVLTLANVEAGDTLSFGATSVDLNTNAATGPDANGFTYTVSSAGATPVVTITHAGATDTLTNTMLNSLVFNNTANNDPSTTARTVTLTSVTDSGSGLTNDGTVATVNVAKADDPLSVSTTGNTVLFTEDAGATSALFAAAMDTVETGDTVTQMVLTLANVEAGDTVLFGATSVDLNTNAATGPDANGFTYTVSSAGASPVVTITHAGATDTLTNTMLNSLVFNNTSNDDPSTTARTVTLTSVTDSGSGLTNDGTVATVNAAKADDAINVATTGNTVLFTEDAGATTALFAATMDTVESGDTVTQVVLTLTNVGAGDTLTFGATSVDLNTNAATGPDANGFTYTVSSAGATPVVTITHAGATDTLTNTMLNSLVFNNTANNDPSTTARTVTLTSVTDSGSGLTNDGTVATVNVAKADDPLAVATTGNTVLFTEDAGATSALFAAAMDTVEAGDTVSQLVLTLANVEAGDTLTFGATSVDLNTNAASGPDANGFTYTVSSAGASPVVTITHAGATDTLTNTMLNSLVFNNTSNDDPSTTARTVTLTSVTDSGSGLTNDGTVATVNVAKADDPLAVATTGNTVLFTEDAGATSALFTAAMDTVETGDTVTQVVLTLANVEAGDTVLFGATSVDLNTNAATGPDANGFTYTVSSAGTTPVVTISHAGATDTLTNTMLNSLVFNNTSNNDPSTTARTVTLTSVTDSGSGLTADGTVATVNVAKANDPLVVSTTGNTVLFTEDAGATTALFAAAMDTVETGDTVSQVVLTLANVEAGDTVLFGATSVDLNTNAATGPDVNGFTYTVSSAGASPVVTISHAGTDDATVNTMMNSLVFNNTSNDDPSTTARTVTLTSVTDSGSGLTADGTLATVNVAKADDPLAVSTTGNTVLFTEDAGATTALFAATMDTVETGDTVTQLVLTLANVEAGDTLTFGATSVDLNTNGPTGPDANGFTYTVSSAGATPVVTISHAGATDTLTNTMLNSLVFNNTSNNDPSTTARTVTLTSVTDSGSGLTADGTVATVNVAKADDPLAVATTGNTVLFTEDAGATTALFAAAIDTVETGDTISQVVLTLANVEAGDTLTFGATSVDLNTNAASGLDANGFTYTVSSAGASPVVTISHAGTDDATVNTMLNSLVFNNTSNNDPSTTARSVTLTSVSDSGSGLTNDGTVATVNIAATDVPLNVATTGNTVLFTEDAGATTVLFAAAMDTVETGDTVTQVVLTIANVEAGDTLTFGATSVDLNTNAATGPDANGFTYTVSSAGATPVVTISHTGATDSLTNTMLNSLVFNNTSNDDPSTTARTVTLTSVTDSGSGLTADGTVATVNVAKTNDAPTVSLINVVTSLPETTSTATAIKIADIVITDVDSGTNNLTLTGADLAHFEIVGTELRIKAGTSLDYEIPADADANHIFDVTVEVDDPGAGSTPDDMAVTTLTVTDDNENPSGTGTLTTTGLNDNAGATSLFAGLTVSDPNTGENDLSLTITLTNPAAGTITGGGFTNLGAGVYRATGLTVSQADTALDNATFTPTDRTGPSGTFTTDISVTVNDQGGGGEQSVLSPTTVTITRVNSAPAGLPVITGNPVESQALTATTDDISDTDGLGAFSFQWLRDGVPIATATSSSYTLVSEDRDSGITVRVEYIDGNGATERVTSAAVGPVSGASAPETTTGPEGLAPTADTPEEVDTPSPLNEIELSAVLPPTGDPVVAGDPESTPEASTGEPLSIESQFVNQIAQLLDAAAADSASSGNAGERPDALPDAHALLRDRALEPVATDMRPLPDSRLESSARQALIAGVEDMQTTMAASGDSRIAAEEFRQTVIQGTLGTLSVGTVTWLLRAGSLVASVFSSIPMWSTMDPLPVLELSKQERKRRQRASAQAGADDASERRMDEILEHSDNRSNSRDRAS